MQQHGNGLTEVRVGSEIILEPDLKKSAPWSASDGQARACSLVRSVRCAAVCFGLAAFGMSGPAFALQQNGAGESAQSIDDAAPAPVRDSIEEIVATSQALLIALQDGAEWPYEGVYRVRRAIPFGYRIGGTAIAADALLRLEASGVKEPVMEATDATEAAEAAEAAEATDASEPAKATDNARRRAIDRATAFIISGAAHPDMAHTVTGTYDVRGWGYAYGLRHLLHVRRVRGEAALGEEGEGAVQFYLQGILATAIPERGGWNYARRGGFDAPGPPSPFMTCCTLHALMDARDQGYEIDEEVITAAMDALERARTATGGFVYAGEAGGRRNEPVPGAIGRMVSAEATLMRAGRSSSERVRGAIDAFFAHWERLEERRAQTGTHVPPFGVAPYYFFYAHLYAAQAIELLPEIERPEYRRKLRERLLQVRDEDGSWNDRVFRRSAAYGTAMALDALRMTAAP